MVLIKNLKIFHLLIFGKISKQNVFDDILERKKVFLYYKKHKVKKVENWYFSKGVSPIKVFGQQFEIFPSFYYCQNQLSKCV